MCSNSPDEFHKTRIFNLATRRYPLQVQSLEFRAHSAAVAEYQLDILHHLRSSEIGNGASLSLIEHQPEIRLNMRPMLLDFLMEVVTIFDLSQLTFPLTINLIDRYCSTRIVKKQHYQLLGLASLWISSKTLDPKSKTPLLNELCRICVDSYDKDLFIEMEKHILKSLEWMVTTPLFTDYVGILLKILVSNSSHTGVSSIVKKNWSRISLLATYICELFQFYPHIYFEYSSLQQAVIAILLSVLLLKIPINILSLSKFFNSLASHSDQSHEFPLELLSHSSFGNIFNQAFFRNLHNIFESPPKSMGTRYAGTKKAHRQGPSTPHWLSCAKISLATLAEAPPAIPDLNSYGPASTPKSAFPSPNDRLSPLSVYSSNDARANAYLTPNCVLSVALPLTPQSNLTSPKRFREIGSHDNDYLFSQRPMIHDGPFEFAADRMQGIRMNSGYPHRDSTPSHTMSMLPPAHLHKRSYDMVVDSEVIFGAPSLPGALVAADKRRVIGYYPHQNACEFLHHS